MEKQEDRAATVNGKSTNTKVLREYQKPEVKKQGDLKKITALSFQPPG
jgi:hypothetical protein